jgi:hypothetical protein
MAGFSWVAIGRKGLAFPKLDAMSGTLLVRASSALQN